MSNTLSRFLKPDPKVVIKKGATIGPSVPVKPLEYVDTGITENHKRLFIMLNLTKRHYS